MSDNDGDVTEQAETQSESEDEQAPEETAAEESAAEARTELTDEDRAKLDKLDERRQKFEDQKRWSDVIKTILEKAEIHVDPFEKAELFAEAGRMYIDRSSNQAEAIKCFERVLEFDERNPEAIAQLKEMYEKRRDWERLLGIMSKEVDLLDPAEQPAKRLEIARIATERVRKPDVNIELWEQVLASDPEQPDALDALSNLYERARRWDPLAEVLEKRSFVLTDPAEQVQLLQKLGMIYADKLKNDDGAVDAFRRLLELSPDDRRAQEQLKKRYVAQKAWDELEEFYAQTQKWDELIRTLERAADDKENTPEQKIALLFKVARLWAEQQDKPDRAARAYEKILNVDDANLEAAEALAPIYQAAGDAKKLVSVYDIRLQHLEDPDERVVLLREAGALYEENLRNNQDAFDRYIEAFTIDPMREVLREDLERLAVKVKDWDRVFGAYATAIEHCDHPDDRSELRVFYGQVLVQAEKVEEAVEQYRAVYDDNPDDARAAAALDRLYRQTENWKDLLAVLERRAELEADPDARKQLAYDIGGLYEEKLDDADRAIDIYQNIPAEFGEGETEAYRRLDLLYEKRERWDDLAAALDHRIDMGPGSDEELAALKFRLGVTLINHLNDKLRALDTLREVVLLMPEHEGALAALEGLLSDSELGFQACAVLEPLYESRDEWGKVVTAISTSLPSLEDPNDRIDAITRMGELQADRLGDHAGAFDSYCLAVKEAPHNPGIVARLAQLAQEQKRVGDMVELLDKLAADNSDDQIARQLWLRAAQIQEDDLGDVEGAVASYRKALERDEADLEVLAALQGIFQRAEQWRPLIEVLRSKVNALTDDDAREEALTQMAFIHADMLEEPEQAIAVYTEVLELNPTSTAAMAALDELYAAQGMWTERADNIARQLELAESDEEHLALMLRLAELRETRMQDFDAAIDIYREVLDRDPTSQAAIGSLERLLTKSEHQLQITEILEPLYRDTGEHQKLVSILDLQVKNSDSPDRKVELLSQMAEIQETMLGDLDAAFNCYARALAEEPRNPDAQENLERLAQSTGAWQRLAEVYEARVEMLGEDDARSSLAPALHTKAAEIRELQLGDIQSAISHYKLVLEGDDMNLEAASALERLYQQGEQYDDLAGVYLTKARIVVTPDEKKGYYFRAGAIYEDVLEQPDRAIEVYRQSLEMEPDDLAAIDKLIVLYNRRERWEDLIGALTQKADIVQDIDERKQLLTQIGGVQETQLGRTETAVETYQRVLEIDPDDTAAMVRLEALYTQAENWEELLNILEREAELCADPLAAMDYRHRIGELHATRLGDVYRAVEVFREILDMFPDHANAVASLERLIAEGKEAAAAAGVLEPIYRAAGESAKLAAVLEVLVAHEEDAIRKVELLHQIAEIREVHLDQGREAFDAFARSLPHDHENPDTLASLERLAEQLNAWPNLAGLYDTEINRLRGESPDAAAQLALRLAKIFEVQIDDVANAIARYRIVYDADPAHEEALAALDRLYHGSGQWAELAEILAREAEVAASPDDVLTFQFRLGQVRQLHLGDVDAAIERYREILAAAPEHEAALAALEGLFAQGVQPRAIGEVLEPLYRMTEAWEKLVRVYEAQLSQQDDADERIVMMHRIAEIAEDKAGDGFLAFTWMQRALMEDPTHDHSVDEVERLASMVDGWPVLASTYAQVLEGGHNPEARVAAGKRLARLYEEELGDVTKAEEAYRYIVAVDDSDVDTLTALDRIYTEHGAGNALAEVLRKRVAAAEDTLDKVELSYRLGNVLYNDVGNTEQAERVFVGVLNDLDAQHEDTIHALQNVYTVMQNWPKLYSTYEKELDVVVGDSAQAEILGRMSTLAVTRLDDQAGAVDLLKRVLDLLGEEPEALNALGNIYAVQENWMDLVDVLEREVNVSEDDSMRVQLYSDLGRVWYDKLNRDRNALESWERVLDIDPANTDALFAMASIHRAAEHDNDLVDTLHRIIDVGGATLEDSAIESVYVELGSLYDTKLEQSSDAVENYNRALEINPRNFQAMDALEKIHAAQEEWEDYIEVKKRRVEALEVPDEQIVVLLDIAKTWEEKLDDKDRGVEAFSRILEVNPLHQEAFDELVALHRRREQFEELIEVYLTRVEAEQEPSARVALLRKVANVYERDLEDRNQAFDALQLAWMSDFTDTETADELERVTGLTQRWNELLTTANQSLEELPEDADPAERNAICVRCARWYGKQGHPEYAIPYLNQVLASDPINRPAMMQMAELHRQAQSWAEYSTILTKLAEMTEDPQEKAETFVQMGELQESQFGAPEQAIKHYKEALKSVPTYLDALKALDRMYRQREQWMDLIDILKVKVNALDDPETKLIARLELAEAYEDRVSDKSQAIERYRAVLEDDPENVQALKGLERLYAQREQWQELLEILEKQLQLVTNERDQVALLMRVAGMWEEEFLKPEAAAERLEQVVDIEPTHSEAMHRLAGLYRTMGKWDEMIQTLNRHVDVTVDSGEKMEIFRSIGQVYRDHLDDSDNAIEAFLNVTAIDDNDRQSLEALADLYDRRGEHSMALETMERLVRLVDDEAERVELLHRMGRLYERELGDRTAAVEHFQRAIDIDGTHLPSLTAMRDIHVEEGDWHAAARVLDQAAEVEQNPRKKAAFLVELGQLLRGQLDDQDRGIETFEAAYRLDPDNEDAAMPLVDQYTRSERWADAMPMLALLVKTAANRDPEEAHYLWYTYGQCAERTGDDPVAVSAYSAAFELNSQDLPSLMGLAAAYFRRRDWDNAFKYYQMILVHHRDDLGAQEITEAFYRVGTIKREQGDIRRALNEFDKALQEDQFHLPTLQALIELYTNQKDFEQVIHYKKRMLDCAETDEERFKLYEEIGEHWQDQLKNKAKAIEAFAEASDLQPHNHVMLHKLLGLYQETGQWAPAIEVIDRVAELDKRENAKAKYSYTIGVILRDELKDPDGALERFNVALDQDSEGMLKAFEAINKILQQKKDWKQLERAFRKMLHRVTGKGDTSLEFNLWHNLGVIYRDRQKNMEAAAEAFAMASRLEPDNMQEHQILAELYTVMPGRIDDAIRHNQVLLRQDPYRVDSYRSLYKLYFDAKQYDKAWCIASTLTFLKKADGEMRQFYDQYKQDGPIRPKSRLDNERWVKDLFHPDEDFLVGKLFEAITPAVLRIKAQPDKTWQLKKKELIPDVNNTTVAFARTFGFVSQLLNLPFTPRLFVCPDRQGGLAYATTQPPASVCGSALLSGINPLDVIFVVGKHLSYYRGEHYIRTMFQTKDEMKLVLLAAMKLAGVAMQDPNVDQWAQQIRSNMQPADMELLGQVAKRFVDAGARADVKQWMRTVELTGCRAGLLLCNSLDIASRMIQAEPPMGTVDLSPKEKVQELVLFSVSEEYFRLREALGITVAVG